jgi:hypothetical protein
MRRAHYGWISLKETAMLPRIRVMYATALVTALALLAAHVGAQGVTSASTATTPAAAKPAR